MNFKVRQMSDPPKIFAPLQLNLVYLQLNLKQGVTKVTPVQLNLTQRAEISAPGDLNLKGLKFAPLQS